MRELLTKEKQAKKDRRNQFIIGIVLIGLMILSTAGFSLMGKSDEKSEKVIYNNIEFEQKGDYWRFELEGYEFITKYNPEQVKDISVLSTMMLEDYIDRPLYFVGNVDENFNEIVRNLNRFVLRTQPACLTEDCEEDFPVKECSKDNLIIVQESLNNSVETMYQDENCIFITASFANQTRYVDAILFDILGI